MSVSFLGATSALADASLTIAVGGAGPSADGGLSDAGSDSIAFGSSTTYIVTINNTGPAADVQLTGALPDFTGVTAVDATCTSDGNAPCLDAGIITCGALTDGGPLFPCDLGVVPTGTTINVGVAVAFPIDPKAVPPTACSSNLDLTFTASNAISTATATFAGATTGFADVSIAVSGPDAGLPGQNLTYSGTIVNNGPCDATTVTLDLSGSVGLAFISAAGDCTPWDPAAATCTLAAPLTNKSSAHFTTVQKVLNLPPDYDGGPVSIIQSAADFTAAVSQDQINNTGDNTASHRTVIKGPQSGGCTSAAGGPMGSLFALGLGAGIITWLARRRSK